MLAQQAKRMDTTRADRASPSRKRERFTTAFMFIDSSNGGVNAKPDKVVRSFVMKSARNKKSWSTRPKSPKSESNLNSKASRGSSCRIGTCNAQPQANDPHQLGYDSPLTPVKKWTVASSRSSRSNSVFSSNGSSWTGSGPVSTHTSPCAENRHTNNAVSFPSAKQPSPPSRGSLFIRSLGSFDCLAVQLDINTKYLLHRCKLNHKRMLGCH